MDDPAWRANFRAAFASDGFIWAWGCAFAEAPRQVLHQVLASRKYRSTKLGELKDTDRFHFDFSSIERISSSSPPNPAFFTTRGADGEFPLTFHATPSTR